MKTDEGLKNYYRAVLKTQVREMEYILEHYLLSENLYFSLQAEIPAWGVFKAHLEHLGQPSKANTPLSLLLEEARCYTEEDIVETPPEEYVTIAFMYMVSMNDLAKWVKTRACYDSFTSMEDVFPGWDEMIKAYREAIYQLLLKGESEFAGEWKRLKKRLTL